LPETQRTARQIPPARVAGHRFERNDEMIRRFVLVCAFPLGLPLVMASPAYACVDVNPGASAQGCVAISGEDAQGSLIAIGLEDAQGGLLAVGGDDSQATGDGAAVSLNSDAQTEGSGAAIAPRGDAQTAGPGLAVNDEGPILNLLGSTYRIGLFG
jgi:hypothetical protein